MPKRPDAVEIKVRRQKKKLDLTFWQIQDVLIKNGGTYNGVAILRGLTEQVRVVVRARHSLPESWAMAILLNNERIDGIDWEQRVKDHRGEKFDCTGWHRHIRKVLGRATHKECLTGFKPTSVLHFIRIGFAILNVELRRVGQDAGKLFDD